MARPPVNDRTAPASQVLAAVDAHVADRIVHGCLLDRAMLGARTRVLVTNQLQHLKGVADWVVVMDAGRIAEQGTYEELVRRAPRQQRQQLAGGCGCGGSGGSGSGGGSGGNSGGDGDSGGNGSDSSGQRTDSNHG